MCKLLIIFLIRKRLGLKKYEHFRFVNQRSESDYYMFSDVEILKIENGAGPIHPSRVSLNWLLNDRCSIEKV